MIDHDPTQPNEAYFCHVDQIVQYVEGLGLFTGFLPTWGAVRKRDGRKTAIFTAENARLYGHLIGERYRGRAVIWTFGGDQNIENQEEYAIIEAMALGLKEGDRGTHLIGYHPRGPGRSSEFLHQAEWLDFNMCPL